MKITSKLGVLASTALLGTGAMGTVLPMSFANAAVVSAFSGSTLGTTVDTVTAGQENGSETTVNGHITNTTNPDIGTGTSHAGIGWQPGDLALNQVPNFDFGTNHTLHSGQTTFPLLGAALPANNISARALVVTDQRSDFGAGLGWNVTLQLGQFVNDSDNTKTLTSNTNVPISLQLFGGPNENGSGAYVEPGLWSGSPAAYYYDGSTGRTDKPQELATPTIDAAGAGYNPGSVAVWGTQGTSGVGTWGLNFANVKSAQLTVPDSAQRIGTYIAKLTWTLQSGPIA